jgi:hypothetical protein
VSVLWLEVAVSTAEPLLFGCAVCAVRRSLAEFCGAWLSCAAGEVLVGVVSGEDARIALPALANLLAALFWHRRRKDRRRAGDSVGAKSAALLAALARRVRESAVPRPALVPGGAG